MTIDPKRKTAGKRASQHGKAFERKCARLLPRIVEHPYWKRNTFSRQHRGDLIPCDAPMLKGKERADLLPDYHIECKFREHGYTVKQVRDWMHDTRIAGKGAEQIYLLVGQGRGPVFAIDCCSNVDDTDWPVQCFMLGASKKGGGTK